MKRTLVGATLDLLMGLVACVAAYGLVRFAGLEKERLALGVAVIYFLAGLVRPDRGELPLVLRSVLISLFGVVAVLMMVDDPIFQGTPYAVTALVFTSVGILVRWYWSRLSTGGRATALILPLVAAALAGWWVFPGYFAFADTYISGPAVEFELLDLEGGTISSADLRGKVILLDFWDTHCGPCRQLMPEMEKLQARYAKDPRVAILVVNAGWEPLQEAQEYAAEQDYALPFAYDPGARVSQAMRVWELPTTILIDPDFNYHSKHIAYEPGRESIIVGDYASLIEELLAKTE